ncbi:MAG TPA: NADPH-dependent F420 reductase [Actinomycetota bacterium]|nr:NADPH-dependent F420 reductase [Actinomycetota bacterium]
MDVAVIGGSGAEGFGLALRLARVGHRVTIGSRDAGRGAEAAARAAERAGAPVEGTDNANAAAAAGADGVVAVTVPYAGQAEIYRSIGDAVAPGAVVLDATSPLATAVGGRPWQVLRPWHGSAAEQARAIVGEGARVVAALHTIAAEALRDLDHDLDSDVLVCGDDAEAKARVGSLLEDVPGLRWVDCGRLEMARVAEPLTALLVSINRTYRVRDSGFRIVGREAWGRPPARG